MCISLWKYDRGWGQVYCNLTFKGTADSFTAMLNVIKPSSGSSVAIIGTGVVGLAALMALKMSKTTPQTVIAVDIVPERLELAKSLGASHTTNSRQTPDLQKSLMEITKGEGVDGCIDLTGRPDVVKSLLKVIAKKGKVVTVGVSDVSSLRDLSYGTELIV